MHSVTAVSAEITAWPGPPTTRTRAVRHGPAESATRTRQAHAQVAARRGDRYRPISRLMISCWISLVPSVIEASLASR